MAKDNDAAYIGIDSIMAYGGNIYIANNGTPGPPAYLTDTDAIDESSPHLASYGANFLAAWSSAGSSMMAVVDQNGQTVEGPITIDAQFAERDDFINFANGDVGWAYSWGNSSELKIVRVRYCD